MKKLIAFFMVAAVVAVTAACGSKSTENSAEAQDSVAVETPAPAPVVEEADSVQADTTAAPVQH